MAPQGSLTPRPPPMISTRQQRRPVPKHVRKAQRQLWRADVMRWCESQERHVEFGIVKHEEKMLAEWFAAIDVDESGTIEAVEISQLMQAMGVEADERELTRMFDAIDKPLDAKLTRPEFLQFMKVNADELAGSSFIQAGGGVFDANTRLMMMAYRRQRLLEDARDPSKRRNFLTAETFQAAYSKTLAPRAALGECLPPPKPPPHPMLAAVATRPPKGSTPRDSPRNLAPLRPRPSPRAPSSMLAPEPKRVGEEEADAAAMMPAIGAAKLPAIGAALPTWDASQPHGAASSAQPEIS